MAWRGRHDMQGCGANKEEVEARAMELIHAMI
jgi:hypothetical protein